MPILNSVFFQGHFVKKLGSIGDKETENEVLLLEHEIPHLPFSTAVLNDLPEKTWSINEEVILSCSNRLLTIASSIY